MPTKIKNILLILITAVFLLGFSVWSVLKPDEIESVSERRQLAEFPALNTKTVLSGDFMTSFEKYTLDHFPLRDGFRTVKAVTSFYFFRQKDNNDIYIKNGYASKLEYPMDKESIRYAADRFRFVYERFIAGTDMKVYLSVIPDKNFFMAKVNGYPSMNYDVFINEIKSEMDFAEYIDITNHLELSDYYRTDTHWRQEKIFDVAVHLASSMGITLKGEYVEKKAEKPFYGVYYGQSALPLPADKISYLDNQVLNRCRVYDYETDTYLPVYNLEKLDGNDGYEMFLSGSKSLLVIENPSVSNGKELIIFRDSFGSSLAPLLAEGYEKITLVDIRYISPNVLERFLTFENQDVLFLYSTSVLNNSITFK